MKMKIIDLTTILHKVAEREPNTRQLERIWIEENDEFYDLWLYFWRGLSSHIDRMVDANLEPFP
jgi:hypothetical protein